MGKQLARGSDNRLAKQIRRAIDASDDEPVEVRMPPHKRGPGKLGPSSPPEHLIGFDRLRRMTPEALKDMGIGQWDEILWLYPDEWYDHIPEGLDVITVLGKRCSFTREMSRDSIDGCLAYGFVRDDDLPRMWKRKREDWL